MDIRGLYSTSGKNSDNKVLKTLEFDKIINRLTLRADSEGGKLLCAGLLPSSDINKITARQSETSAALSRIMKKGKPSFSRVYNISESLKRLELGSSLNTSELIKTADLLDNAAFVKKYGKREKNHTCDDCLDASFDSLILIEDLKSEIRRCILSENEISDSASRTLYKIRKSIKQNEDKIHSQLNTILNSSLRTCLQDSVVTIRNGRYCLPVKSEFRSNVPGMLHDQSSSGATVFIEPMAVIKINNDIRQLESDESKEVAAILAKLSGMVYENSGSIKSDIEILTNMDFIFARASLAMEMNAVEPLFNEEGYIDLKKARHPLISRSEVIPTDISLGKDFDILVVTGPNTGGKTVALKTVGLLTLMGQSGLHIPAKSRSSLTIFESIFADIGDEQSIEQSLSTFSSHMKNVIEIVDNADANSLVLFDELGAGTDPVEGAALARAILEFMQKLQIKTVCTTHFSELKLFAISADRVENACCEFDVNTLKPTFRFLIGIPGKSNAFAISKKLGLNPSIIDNASGFVNEQDKSFEEIISELESQKIAIEKDKLEAERLKAQSKASKENYERLEKNLILKKSELIRQANEEAFKVLKEAKDYADSVIRNLNKANEYKPEIKDLEEIRRNLRKKINDSEASMLEDKKKKVPGRKLDSSEIKIGEHVKVCSMDVKGIITSLPDSKGFVNVQMGILKSKIPLSDLEKDYDSDDIEPIVFRSKKDSVNFSKSYSISSEINLIGKTVDDAVMELDKYLDDAYLAHLPYVRIVHGKGTGALRNGIHKYLKRNSVVKEFKLAEFGEGDAGVTIVKFKCT